MAAGALIGSFLTSLMDNIFNYSANQQTNNANKEINKEQLDYARETTQQAWERDDTYYQRSVEDLTKAGLSPLALNGSMPNTSPLSAPSPIAMTAPQFDFNKLAQAFIESESLGETKRHNETEEALRGAEINNTAKEIKIKSQQLDIQNKDVESQIKYRANMAALESRRIDELVRNNKVNENLNEKKHELEKLSFESKRYYEEIKHQAGGEDVPYRVYDDYESYLTAREIYLEAFNSFIDEVGLTRQAKADSSQIGFNGGASFAGTGGNAGISNNESAYDMKDWSQQNEIAWKKFQRQYPVPVFYNK